ncbi:MAG: hypothetical protein MAG451_02283 [Anaerolineales bacterium]|nr:hypothetical protein [Anaerolineales bacterium]
MIVITVLAFNFIGDGLRGQLHRHRVPDAADGRVLDASVQQGAQEEGRVAGSTAAGIVRHVG